MEGAAMASSSAVRLRHYSALVIALACATGTMTAHALPPIGSADVSIADPVIPPPPTTPCVVKLFDQFTFADYNGHPFAYAPPVNCAPPWDKVVLTVDYDVTMGRQFDRTAQIWIGGANIYFGTTQEPRATVAPTWHIERDLTDYAPLFLTAHGGRADLGNTVDDTYTGIIHGSADLLFYPASANVPDHPPRPDALLPLSASPDGGTVDLADADARLSATFTLPTNIERAFLDVIAQSQSDDEFWYLCVPDSSADELQSCPGSGFRESQVSIDGVPAGVAPIYPWIFTGGIDPGLWRPSPSIQTLAFEPYRVDLSPFAGLLSDGEPHTIELGVFNTKNHFATTANLLLYLDGGSDQVSGEVTTNTLDAAPTPQVEVTDASDTDLIKKQVSVTSMRTFEIAGFVQTSHGRITTDVQQTIAFSNVQQFAIGRDGKLYHQDLTQSTAIDSTTTLNPGFYQHVLHEQTNWPLTVSYSFDETSQGWSQVTAIDQGLQRATDVGVDGYVPHVATLDQRMLTGDTLLFDFDFNAIGRTAQGSTQTFVYQDPFGTCYDRSITTADGVLTATTDGASCPDGLNTLSWFDPFRNAGSSIFGATVQILR
jgi:hypothetical protein